MAVETPIPIALLCADEVYQDAITGKWVICGVFSRIWGSRLPIVREQVVIFWQVTSLRDPVDLRLRIEHSETGEPIFDGHGPVSAKTPLDVVSMTMKLRSLPFGKVGKYWVQLLSGEEILIQSPLQVTLREQPGPDERIEKEAK